MLDEEGNLLGYRGADIDITERKRAEEALFQQTREVAVLEERSRLARDLHKFLIFILPTHTNPHSIRSLHVSLTPHTMATYLTLGLYDNTFW